MAVYYNEHDWRAAAWLRGLIAEGVLPDGDVDERSIADVSPTDVLGYRQCHWFAGIGGWAYALRLAGWSDDEPVWTGSCPCQRFSSATRGRATARDWWPEFRRLVVACRPRVVFGEQVASAGGWFDGVCDDLEAVDYTIGAAVLPACGVGQDHRRERLYFGSHTDRYSEPGRAVHAEAPWLSRPGSESERLVLEDGVSIEVALYRGFGNAIVPALAAEFISAYREAMSVEPHRVEGVWTNARS